MVGGFMHAISKYQRCSEANGSICLPVAGAFCHAGFGTVGARGHLVGSFRACPCARANMLVNLISKWTSAIYTASKTGHVASCNCLILCCRCQCFAFWVKPTFLVATIFQIFFFRPCTSDTNKPCLSVKGILLSCRHIVELLLCEAVKCNTAFCSMEIFPWQTLLRGVRCLPSN